MTYTTAKSILLSGTLLILAAGCNNTTDEQRTPVKQAPHAATTAKQLSTPEIAALAEKKFDDYLPKILESHDGAIDLKEIHTGDFTGDGKEDVAIYFSLSPKGGGNALVGQGLTLYENTGSDAKVIGGYEPGYIFTFDTISDGKIQVIKLEYADGDGHCCPSIRTNHTLTISGDKVE